MRNTLITVIICLVLTGIAFYIYQQKVDEEIQAAQERTKEAQFMLDQAQRRTAIKELELTQVTARADNARKVADKRIAELEQATGAAERELEQTKDEKAIIATRLSNLELEILPDINTETAIQQAAVLYPVRFLDGVVSEARLPELIQLMNIEVQERRELAISNNQMILQLGQQVKRKDQIITEYKIKQLADQQIREALENANGALKLEGLQCVEVVSSQTEQIRLWKTKAGWKWTDNIKLAGALAIGFAAGRLGP